MRPVEHVSWNDCRAFAVRLNGRLDGLELALPSEAQWEYACRAGTNTARYLEELAEIAWYSDNSDGQTHPVGLKRPNAWGLFDMLGNVWEWCADLYRPYGGGALGDAASDVRVLRGGSWGYYARDVRAANRNRLAPGNRIANVGFRCAEFREGAVG
jgi:formylglycine-generating enzyme required for sulfatase activity